jgi:hypothetical protein
MIFKKGLPLTKIKGRRKKRKRPRRREHLTKMGSLS